MSQELEIKVVRGKDKIQRYTVNGQDVGSFDAGKYGFEAAFQAEDLMQGVVYVMGGNWNAEDEE